MGFGNFRGVKRGDGTGSPEGGPTPNAASRNAAQASVNNFQPNSQRTPQGSSESLANSRGARNADADLTGSTPADSDAQLADNIEKAKPITDRGPDIPSTTSEGAKGDLSRQVEASTPTTTTTDANGSKRDKTETELRADIEAELKAKFNKTKASDVLMIMGGLALGIVAAIFVAKIDATNARVNIQKITIEKLPDTDTSKNTHRKVNVYFDRKSVYSRSCPDSRPGCLSRGDDAFNPVPGDVINFVGVCNIDKDYRVYESDYGSLSIKMSIQDINSNFGNSSLITKQGAEVYDDADIADGTTTTYTYRAGDDGDGSDDQIDVYTSFTNQLVSDIVNAIIYLAGAAAEVVTQLVTAAGGAASAGFCMVVPILCDGTIWLIIGFAILAIVAFMFLKP
jgi:hypothetical protein